MSALLRFGAAARTSVTAAGAAVAGIANANPVQVLVKRIEVFLATAVASELGLAWTTTGTQNAGIDSTCFNSALDPGGIARRLATTWTVQPTKIGGASDYIKKVTLPATIASYAIWDFETSPFILTYAGLNQGLTIFNCGAAPCGLLDVNVEYEAING